MKKILGGLAVAILTLDGNAAFADDSASIQEAAQIKELASEKYVSSDSSQYDKALSDELKLLDNSDENKDKRDSQDYLAAASEKAVQSESDKGNSSDKKSDEVTNIEKSGDSATKEGSDWKSGDNNSDSGDIYKGDSEKGDSGSGEGGKIAAPVPEESTLALSLTGLGMLGWISRRKREGKKGNV